MGVPRVSRRSVLAGGAAMALLAACGGGDDSGGDAGGGDTTPDEPGELTGTLLILVPTQGLFTTGTEQRVPLAVADAEGVPVREGLEPRTFEVRRDGAEPVTVEVEPRTDGVPTPYYPVRFTPEGAGIHEITLAGESGYNAVTLEVGESSDVPGVGQALPPVQTPTVDAERGVTPICTRTPPCDLHATTLTDALAAGGPVALLIATPEFCQTAVCGPVLELLEEVLLDFPGVTAIHAEVYADPRGADDPTAGGLAPIAEQYALPFEPVLYLTDTDGTVVERLDSVYDRTELREALTAVS